MNRGEKDEKIIISHNTLFSSHSSVHNFTAEITRTVVDSVKNVKIYLDFCRRWLLIWKVVITGHIIRKVDTDDLFSVSCQSTWLCTYSLISPQYYSFSSSPFEAEKEFKRCQWPLPVLRLAAGNRKKLPQGIIAEQKLKKMVAVRLLFLQRLIGGSEVPGLFIWNAFTLRKELCEEERSMRRHCWSRVIIFPIVNRKWLLECFFALIRPFMIIIGGILRFKMNIF